MQARHSLTILAVQDLAAATRFYATGFGWTQIVDAPVYAEFALPGDMRFGVYQRHSFAKNTGILPAHAAAESTTATELYFYVTDLDATVAKLQALGARMLSPASQREWGDEVAYLTDLDGNILALARE